MLGRCRAALLAVLVLAGAGTMLLREASPSEPPGPSPINLVILPVENVRAMYEKFLPLKDHLEQTLSRPVVLSIARDYRDAIESIGRGKAQLAYLDPSAYCEARHRYGVIPLVKTVSAGASTYRSVIVTRQDSPIRKVADAKRKRLALGNARSSSSSLIPELVFKEVGISLRDFRAVDYLEHEDRIALSVLTGRHDLGGLSERVAAKYRNDGLRVIKTSESIPQYSLCAAPGMEPDLRARIVRALTAIGRDRTPGLIAAMKDIDGFAPAGDRDFDVVRVMIKNLTGTNYLVYGKNTVKVAILPLYSAITLFDRFDPLMRHLSRATGYEFKLVIPKDFEAFFSIVEQGGAEYTYSNPYIYIQLADRKLLSAFAMTVMPTTGDIFRGIIITNRDSAINSIDDLKGKRVMVVSYRSAGGFLAQKLLLAESGIDVDRDLILSEGKRQEVVILNVYRKAVDAGFVRESALDVLTEEIDISRIRLVARTPYIANWPFARTVRADDALTALVRRHLLELADPAVLSPAQVSSFKPATDKDFDRLRGMIGKP